MKRVHVCCQTSAADAFEAAYFTAASYPNPPSTLSSELAALEKVYLQRMSEQR